MKQSNPKIIGLTGGISTGKSTVSSMLSEKGYYVIDADKVARQVVEKGEEAYFEIVEFFGNGILLENGEINREALGEIIFNNHDLRKKLNAITHPYIVEEIKNQIKLGSNNNSTVFIDAPLLFEQYSIWEEYSIEFHEIWLVYCDKDIQINRLMERDNISKDQAIKIIYTQMPLEKKKKMSSKTIDNSKDIGHLKKQIEELLKTV